MIRNYALLGSTIAVALAACGGTAESPSSTAPKDAPVATAATQTVNRSVPKHDTIYAYLESHPRTGPVAANRQVVGSNGDNHPYIEPTDPNHGSVDIVVMERP
jgi:hypothetical protein